MTTLYSAAVCAPLARQAEIDVVGEAENGPEGVKLAASTQPGRGVAGLEHARFIRWKPCNRCCG